MKKLTVKLYLSLQHQEQYSVACQIAKIKDCHVVGSTSSLEKVKWLLDKARIEYAFNYKEVGEGNISSELRKLCPTGIDIYFENVGGKHLETVLDNVKAFGKIVLCYMISQYNATTTSQSAEPPQPPFSNNHSTHDSGIYSTGSLLYAERVLLEYVQMVNEGKIKWEETVFEGLGNAPKAFIALFI